MIIRCIVFVVSMFAEVFAHGMSEKQNEALNAAAPQWLSITSPIMVTPSDGEVQYLDQERYRDKSGGATNSRNRVYIPSKNLVHEFPYNLAWRGGRDEGYGVSLSPDGKRLIVCQRAKNFIFRMYEIDNKNNLNEVDVLLPNVTYDEGPKGFISRWYWASNEVLIGCAEILNEEGHELVESRLYVYHTRSKSLARMNLSQLEVVSKEPHFVEIQSISKDMSEVVVKIGEERQVGQVDLNSLHTMGGNEGAGSSAPTHGNLAIQSSKVKDAEIDDESWARKDIVLWVVGACSLIFVSAFWLRMVRRKKG